MANIKRFPRPSPPALREQNIQPPSPAEMAILEEKRISLVSFRTSEARHLFIISMAKKERVSIGQYLNLLLVRDARLCLGKQGAHADDPAASVFLEIAEFAPKALEDGCLDLIERQRGIRLCARATDRLVNSKGGPE